MTRAAVADLRHELEQARRDLASALDRIDKAHTEAREHTLDEVCVFLRLEGEPAIALRLRGAFAHWPKDHTCTTDVECACGRRA